VTLGSGFPGLTVVDVNIHLIPPGVASFQSVDVQRIYAPTTSALYTPTLVVTSASYWRGPVPAIDFGDGSTIPVTTLTSASTTNTVGGFTTRVFRGSFSHTYGDQGDYAIRVASPPNTYPLVSVAYGSALTRDGYPLERTYGIASQWYFTTPISDQHSTLLVNILLGTSTTLPTTTDITSTVTGGNQLHFSPFGTVGAVGQVAATTAASLSVIEVPAASTWGLLVLALILAATAVVVIRR